MKKFQIELNKLPTENAGEIVISIDESIMLQEKNRHNQPDLSVV